MKKVLFSLCMLILLVGCNNPGKLAINGTVNVPDCSMIYMYQITDQAYGRMNLIDSIAVVDGKFAYVNDSLKADLYGFAKEYSSRNYGKNVAYLLLEPSKVSVTLSEGQEGEMEAVAAGSALADKYVAFNKEKAAIGNQAVLDSLDKLFYAAREIRDTAEMARVKKASTPYYEESSKNKSNFIDQSIEKEKGTLFGLYLYYTNRFQHNIQSTMEEINKTRENIAAYDEDSKKSDFYQKIQEGLSRFENCAIGHEAPDIAGVDTLGNTVNLKDFRGKYVLVDFWSSGCGWCRLETPNILKVFNEFKDKNFTVLGVSSDYRKADWTKAIEEDKSYWNQILLNREDVKSIFDSYCIVGIPHIILVNPEGVIVAKELRGEDLINTVTEHVTKQ